MRTKNIKISITNGDIEISQTIIDPQDGDFEHLVKDTSSKFFYAIDQLHKNKIDNDYVKNKKDDFEINHDFSKDFMPMSNPSLPYQPQNIPPNPNPSSWMSLSKQEQIDIENVLGNFPKINDFEINSPIETEEYNKKSNKNKIFDTGVLDIDLPDF